METIVDTLIEQHRQTLTPDLPDEARQRLESYLRAWPLSEERREDLRAEIVEAFQRQLAENPSGDPTRIAIEEAAKIVESDRGSRIGALKSCLEPERPIETPISSMQTSLSRLPSLRILAGWLVLIVLLILTFKVTHH